MRSRPGCPSRPFTRFGHTEEDVPSSGGHSEPSSRTTCASRRRLLLPAPMASAAEPHDATIDRDVLDGRGVAGGDDMTEPAQPPGCQRALGPRRRVEGDREPVEQGVANVLPSDLRLPPAVPQVVAEGWIVAHADEHTQATRCEPLAATRRGKTGEAGGLQVRKRRLKRVRHLGAATTRHPDVLGVHAGVEVVAVAVFLEKGVEGRQEVAHRRMVAQQ